MKAYQAVLSKPGGRPANEDACGYRTSAQAGCWVVSDGLGGYGGGEIASKLVVGTVLHGFRGSSDCSARGIEQLLALANDAVLGKQRLNQELRAMRATAAVLVLDFEGGCATWGHVGDTRIYWFRRVRVYSQTRDHSVVQSLVDAGLLGPEEVRNHPNRSLLLGALGDAEPIEPSIKQPFGIEAGDAFLLCSDGLWEFVHERVMEEALQEANDPEQWLARIESVVLRRAPPQHDNYTAMGIWVDV